MTKFILTIIYEHTSKTYIDTHQYDLLCIQQKQGRSKPRNKRQSYVSEGRKAQ